MLPAMTGDTYDSPEHTDPCLREFLMLGTRWSPYTNFFGIMFRSRKLALEGKYDDAAWEASSLETISRLERCGAHFHCSGMGNIESVPGPAVFISNHMSTLETFCLPAFICPRKKCTYIVKEKLMNGKIWGPIMRSRGPIAVTRKDPRKDLETVMTEGQRILGEDRSIIVFPQGTRTPVFSRSGFNSLGIKLAAKAGVHVVPVAVKTDYWGNSPIFRGFGPVNRKLPVMVEFGPPMAVEGRGKAEHEAVLDFIESRLRTWGAEISK